MSITENDFYTRPENLIVEVGQAGFLAVPLDDDKVREVWSWREKESIACEIAFLMDEERGCCAELAAILERQPELANRVFEHCWEDWLGNDYDVTITESVMMSVEDWIARYKRVEREVEDVCTWAPVVGNEGAFAAMYDRL